MKPAGLILAAGESRRMGSPKALLDLRGETFLDRLVRIFSGYCEPVIVVLGADATRVRESVRNPGAARFVVNEDYRLGQLSSLQCGLRAVPADAAGVLWTLVDHPNVQPETVAALLGGSGVLRIPRYRGRRGHPVYIAAGLVAEFLSLAPGATARDVVDRHAAELEYIEVDDAGVLDDIDDREAYGRLTGEAPR